MTSGVLAATAFAVAGALTVVATAAPSDGAKATSLQVEVPFSGPGQLLTIWERGGRRTTLMSRERALVLTRSGVSQRVPGIDPRGARWRLPTELLVEQYRDSGTRIVRLQPSGEVLEVLSDVNDLGDSEPSPNGRWVVLERHNAKGRVGIEVRDLDRGFALESLHGRDSDARFGKAIQAIWSPDSEYLALALRTHRRRADVRGLLPELAILPREGGSLKEVPDGVDGEEPGGVFPLFWNPDGIYARSSRGLLRCDPRGSGCVLIYAPGEGKFAFTGTAVGQKSALLLVQDHKRDPFEARAHEIHEVDLTTGVGRVLLRLPDGVFITDIDWIEDSAEGKPEATTPSEPETRLGPLDLPTENPPEAQP